MIKEKDATAVDIKDEVKTDEQVNIKPEKSPSKFKESFKKNKTLYLILCGVIILAILIGVLVHHSKKPVSVVNDLKVEFTGYDGYGTIKTNDKDFAITVTSKVLKKAGFNKKQIATMQSMAAQGDFDVDDTESGQLYFLAQGDKKFYQKLQLAANTLESFDYKFNKTENLKNGDKVVLIVTAPVGSLIKSEKKTFTVKGLKPTTKIKLDDLMKENKLTFSGFNGYGVVNIPKVKVDNNEINLFELDGDVPHDLKNGDTVKFKVNNEYLNYLENQGKALDKINIDVKVSGLKEVNDIKNLKALFDKNATLVKSEPEYENDEYSTYTIEKKANYIKVSPASSYSQKSDRVSCLTVFKITENNKYSDEPRVEYVCFGYSAYILKDMNADIDTAQKLIGDYLPSDLENLTARLKTDGYKEYKPAK